MPEQLLQEGWSSQPRTPDPRKARRRRLSRLTITGGIVLLALCGGLTWFFFHQAPGGPFTAFLLPVPGSTSTAITTGPDGNLWFTEYYSNKIGRITTSGSITEFSIPTRLGAGTTEGITTGPDGNLWFTESGSGYGSSDDIGRISPSGIMTEFRLPPSSFPESITTGPDGNLWFSAKTGKIGRITTSGSITEFVLPRTGGDFIQITTGPDGNLWFTESDSNKIGHITTSGTITEFSIPTAHSRPEGITTGPDGHLWFTENGISYEGSDQGQIERLSTPGK